MKRKHFTGRVNGFHPDPKSPADNFLFIKCAQKALDQFGDKKPTPYKAIAKIAIDKGRLETKRQTSR